MQTLNSANRFDVTSNSFYLVSFSSFVGGDKAIFREQSVEYSHKMEFVGKTADLIDRITAAKPNAGLVARVKGVERALLLSRRDYFEANLNGEKEVREIGQMVAFFVPGFEFIATTPPAGKGQVETIGRRLSLWNKEKQEVRSAEEIKRFFGIDTKPL